MLRGENETDEDFKKRTKRYKMYKGVYRQSDAMYVDVISNEEK